MRLSSATPGLIRWMLVGLLLSTGLARAAAGHSQPPETIGCLFVVVTDSITSKPLALANCAAVDLMKGALSDSLGRCRICGLPQGTVVLTTRANWHVQRRDTVRVQRGRTDTLHVRLRRLRPPKGTTFDYGAKH